MEQNDFRKYGMSQGIPGTTIDSYSKHQDRYQMKNGLYQQPQDYISPTIIEERQLNVASMDVFSRLMMDRIIFLHGPITEELSVILQAQLQYLNSVDPTQEITLQIASPGGSVYAGNGLLDVMDYIECDVRTINMSMCASMASVLLAAGTKGKRMALKRSRTMLHMSSGSASGQILDAEKNWEEWKRLNDELFEDLARCCDQSSKKIKEIASRDHWMTSSETKSFGLIDEIITSKKKD